MMDSKDLEAEIHPLKNEDGKLQENLENQAKKEDSLKSSPLQSRLSRCRTVAFFLSLFICLLGVFVISFIIPCPDRPASQGTWRINYDTAGAASPLRMAFQPRSLGWAVGSAWVSRNLEVILDGESTLSGCQFCVRVFPGIWRELQELTLSTNGRTTVGA